MSNSLPKRSEIDDKYKWKLEHIYATETAWEDDYKRVEELSSQFEKYNGKLAESPQMLLECVQLEEKLGRLFENMATYASMKRDEDTTDSRYQALLDRVSTLGVKANSLSSFITPEILAFPDGLLEKFYSEEPKLKYFKTDFDEILRGKAHVLSQAEEELLSKVGRFSSASSTTFNMINNADLKFGKIKDENNEEVELTKGNYSRFVESKDKRVRKEAFEAMYAAYMNLKNTIASTLHGNIKKNVFYTEARKYPSSLERALFQDNISVEVYENLIKAVHDNLKPLHEYLEVKKKFLGLDEFHMYDMYVPLMGELDINIPYEEAYDTMLQGLAPLGEEYINVLKEARTSGWIDVYETPGKRGGAYCSGPNGTHPYVLLNHQDNLNSMFTLAHEMGHAMHSYLSDKHQPRITAQYTIFVAEVASTVNEILLMKHLLANTQDKNMKLYLLNYFLEQFRTTLYRQTQFAEFEKITHEKVEAGVPLTADEFSKVYLELNQNYYGDSIIHDEQIAYEWTRIPHFYSAFYVYKYATGFSAAVSISKQILEEGKPALDRYMKFLQSGGSDFPIELLKIAGVDMTTPQPITDALEVFSGLVEELKELLDKK